MTNSRQNREESIGLQRVEHFVSLERRRDQEANRTPSVWVETDYTNQTSRSQLRPEVIFLMTKRHEISGWRLTACARSCVAGCMLAEIERPYQAQVLI